eukprot:jgi/Botrbrau1/18203/Bobra.53_1s0062.1
MPRKRTGNDASLLTGNVASTANKRLKFEVKEQQPEKRSILALLLSQAASQPPRKADPDLPKPRPSPAKVSEPWTVKHAPHLPADLVVHKRKVTDVRDWLCSKIGWAGTNSCLVVTGPAGSGKSATVKALAAELHFDVVEWHPPAPTSWSEHQYHVGMGGQYMSKLDEFEAFVSRSKFVSLSLAPSSPLEQARGPPRASHGASGPHAQPVQPEQATGGPGWVLQTPPKDGGAAPAAPRPKLVVVDDIPYAIGDSRKRLEHALEDLAASSRCPVVVLLTSNGDSPQGPQSNSSMASSRDVAAVLSHCSSTTISFNPITAPNIAEGVVPHSRSRGSCGRPSTDQGGGRTVGGRPPERHRDSAMDGHWSRLQAKARRPEWQRQGQEGREGTWEGAPPTEADLAAASQRASVTARDVTLGLFHVLGKVLYNKKVGGGSHGRSAGKPARGQHAGPVPSTTPRQTDLSLQISQVSPRFQRPRMKSDPEDILMHSNLGAATSMAFLHENMLQFMMSIDEVADSLDYLRTADCMLGGGRRGMSQEALEDDMPGRNLTESLAALISMRGLMFANTQPAPRSFTPLQAPQWRLVQRGTTANYESLLRLLWTDQSPLSPSWSSSATQYASTVLPFVRQMAACAPHSGFGVCLPERWSRLWNGKLTEEVRQWAVWVPDAVSHRAHGTSFGPDSDGEEDVIADSDVDVIDLT